MGLQLTMKAIIIGVSVRPPRPGAERPAVFATVKWVGGNTDSSAMGYDVKSSRFDGDGTDQSKLALQMQFEGPGMYECECGLAEFGKNESLYFVRLLRRLSVAEIKETGLNSSGADSSLPPSSPSGRGRTVPKVK